MKKYFDILKDCSLFDGIHPDDLERMLTCMGARVDSFDKKYTIFAEGTPAKYVGIVLSGEAQTVRGDLYGNRTILSQASAPELVGEAFACAQIQSIPVSVIASEPCEMMFIDCGHILHTCQNNCGFHQQLIFNLMKDLAVKSIRFHQKSEITSKRSTREKLMTYLSMMEKETGSRSFEIPFDRQELADYLEVDRSGLSAEISKMRKEGILDSHKNRFTLL